MHTPLLNFQFIVALAILVYFADVAIHAGIARDVIKCICYSIVAILALIFVVMTLLGVS
jgi:hypothetical protein